MYIQIMFIINIFLKAHTVFLSNLSHSHLLDMLSGGEDEEEGGSYSSAMSNKSEKNMADFDGEESPCEDELAQLAARVSHFSIRKD